MFKNLININHSVEYQNNNNFWMEIIRLSFIKAQMTKKLKKKQFSCQF
jgi:hypothetical protein